MPKYLITADLKKETFKVTRYRDQDIEKLTETKDSVLVRFILSASTMIRAKQIAPYATKRVVNEIIKERKQKD